MKLDLYTLMITITALSLLLSGLLVLASLHAWKIRGVRYWAAANLCISLGLALPLIEWKPGGLGLVAGAILLAAGFGLQYLGIRLFRGLPVDWRLPAAAVLIVAGQSYWLTVAQPQVGWRAVLNSAVFALLCAASARLLLIRLHPPQRTAYWLTGLSFAGLALVFALRAAVIAASEVETYRLYANVAINPSTFFLAGVAQLSIGFGFVLMMNYRLADELQTLAAHDSLTGALTRRSLIDAAERLLARCRESGAALSLMMIDVDHFKQINDRFGHVAGDEVLCRLAAVVRASIRAGDCFARYGGEEFCILLPGLTVAEAAPLAERLRRAYADNPLCLEGEHASSTISIGLADTANCGHALAELIAAADAAMYAAKQCGRNQVQVFAAA